MISVGHFERHHPLLKIFCFAITDDSLLSPDGARQRNPSICRYLNSFSRFSSSQCYPISDILCWSKFEENICWCCCCWCALVPMCFFWLAEQEPCQEESEAKYLRRWLAYVVYNTRLVNTIKTHPKKTPTVHFSSFISGNIAIEPQVKSSYVASGQLQIANKSSSHWLEYAVHKLVEVKVSSVTATIIP